MTASKLFLPLMLIKAIGMILIILYAGIGLGPDEAQYWTWSRHIDVGYYSKPPGVAWQIFSTTSLLGSTELGVRLSAVILGTLFALAVYRLGIKTGCSPDGAAFAGLMAAFTPIGIFSTFLAITDGGLLLFWTLGLSVLAEATHRNKVPVYPLFGLFVACGAIFKWPIYILWAVVAVAWVFYPQIRSKTVISGIVISLCGLLPTLYWNIGHDFATFRHVTTIIQGGNDGGAAGNPLEFIGSQIVLISPIIFVLGCIALFRLKNFLAWVTIGILSTYIAYSFFKKGQGNWCLFAYPSLFVWLATVFYERFWIKAGLVLSVMLALIAFAIPAVQKNSSMIPWKLNPFRHNLGWKQLDAALKDFDPKKQFLFADKYQNTSLLSFYNPSQAQAFFFNLLGSRKNQFSYWPGPEIGKDGIFVIVEQGNNIQERTSFYLKALAPYFEKIESFHKVSLFEVNGKTVKEALFFNCIHYLGELPKNPEKY